MKSLRQMTILQIIQNHDIETQEQLADALQARGIVTTQATVSRDIKQMRLIKVMTRGGAYKYALPDKTENDMNDRLTRMLSDSLLNVAASGNMIVIHTLSGAAGAAAEALDALQWPEILGTIAGDNTIFMVVRAEAESAAITARVRDLMK